MSVSTNQLEPNCHYYNPFFVIIIIIIIIILIVMIFAQLI